MRINGKSAKNHIDPKQRRAPVFIKIMLALIILMSLLLAAAPLVSRAQQPRRAEVVAPQREPQERDINAMFYNFESPEFDLKEAAKTAQATGRIALQLKGRKYDLELESSALLALGFRAVITTDNGEIEDPATSGGAYRGRVTGEEESEVRLMIQDDLMSGYIRTKNDWIFIDPLSKYKKDAQPGQLVVYRDADVRPEARGTCGSEGLDRQSKKLLKKSDVMEANAAAAVVSSPRIVEVATDADFEFFQANGANSNAVIRGILNQIDGIYIRELRLTLRITFQNVFATATDPYTSTDPSTLLAEFRNSWNANRVTVQRDVAHLFTAKNLNGSVVGIASVGVVCNNPAFAYGVSQQGAATAQVTAHEIGHNLGASHDDASLCNGGGPIMCPSTQNFPSNEFSQVSEDAIKTHVNDDGDCLEGGSGVWAGLSNGADAFNGDIWAIQAVDDDAKTFSGDFNGDGRTDLLKIDESNNCNGGLWVGLSDGDHFNFSRWATWCTPSSIKVLTGDFNGDGRTDVMKFDQDGNCNGGLWVGLSNGVDGFNTSRWATWCTPSSIKVFAGDFNGDGRTDVMKIDQDGNCNGGLWVGLSNGANAFNTSRWATWCTPGSIKVLTGDFNGDGRTDVMKFDQDGGCNGGLWVGLSNGVNAFNTNRWATWCTPSSIKVFAGDFNGDGRTDVMKIDQDGNCNGGLWVGLSNGANAFNTDRWATWCTPGSIKVLTGDFNGDARTDIMKIDQDGNCNGGLWVGLSNGGNAFNTNRWATWCTPSQIKPLAGDFNGDGWTDIVKFDVP